MDQKILLDGLSDAHCPINCIESAKTANSQKLFSILKEERARKLDIIHQKEKEIDILDYLIFLLNKEMENGSKI